MMTVSKYSGQSNAHMTRKGRWGTGSNPWSWADQRTSRLWSAEIQGPQATGQTSSTSGINTPSKSQTTVEHSRLAIHAEPEASYDQQPT